MSVGNRQAAGAYLVVGAYKSQHALTVAWLLFGRCRTLDRKRSVVSYAYIAENPKGLPFSPDGTSNKVYRGLSVHPAAYKATGDEWQRQDVYFGTLRVAQRHTDLHWLPGSTITLPADRHIRLAMILELQIPEMFAKDGGSYSRTRIGYFLRNEIYDESLFINRVGIVGLPTTPGFTSTNPWASIEWYRYDEIFDKNGRLLKSLDW